MKIWLDTAKFELIKQAVNLGLLHGVTTNPELIAQSGKTLKQVLQELLPHFDGPIAAQVIAADTSGMVGQGKQLHQFSNRIIVKIPVTKHGLEAIKLLSQENIPTMATVVFQPHQALTAALAGAQFIAPYVSRIEKIGYNPWDTLNSMLRILHNYKLDTQILAASLGTLDRLQKCAEIGIPHATIKEPLFEQLISTLPDTQECIDHFDTTWKKANFPAFL